MFNTCSLWSGIYFLHKKISVVTQKKKTNLKKYQIWRSVYKNSWNDRFVHQNPIRLVPNLDKIFKESSELHRRNEPLLQWRRHALRSQQLHHLILGAIHFKPGTQSSLHIHGLHFPYGFLNPFPQFGHPLSLLNQQSSNHPPSNRSKKNTWASTQFNNLSSSIRAIGPALSMSANPIPSHISFK